MKVKSIIVQKTIPLESNKVSATKNGVTLMMGKSADSARIYNYLNGLGENTTLLVEKEDGSRESIENVTLETISPTKDPKQVMVKFRK